MLRLHSSALCAWMIGPGNIFYPSRMAIEVKVSAAGLMSMPAASSSPAPAASEVALARDAAGKGHLTRSAVEYHTELRIELGRLALSGTVRLKGESRHGERRFLRYVTSTVTAWRGGGSSHLVLIVVDTATLPLTGPARSRVQHTDRAT